MAEVKWIKIVTDIFDDEKILLIESAPDADAVIVIWFKLLCLAGKQNNDGVFMMNNRIAYTEEMLATIFRRPVNTIRMALAIFEQYGMIERVNDVITIPNWNKHQSLDALENKRNYQRELMRKRREQQKLLSEANCDTNSEANSEANVSILDKNRLEVDKIREEENSTVPNGTVCRTKDVRRVIEEWNRLGLAQLTDVKADTKRGEMLRARVNEYGVDAVVNAIHKVNESGFLRGQNKSGWIISFEWFVKPNNFIKVMEGSYDTKRETAAKTSPNAYGFDPGAIENIKI